MNILKRGSAAKRKEPIRRIVHVGMRSGLLSLCAALLTLGLIHSVSAQNDSSKKDNKQKTDSTQKTDGKKETPTGPPRRVLIFSPDAKGGVSEQIGDDINSVEESRLTATHLYEPIHFLSSLPTIKLALSDQSLTPTDVKHPYDNDSKLKKLAGISGYDLVMATSVDDYEYDAVKNQVNLVISARMIDYSGAKAVVRSAGASASSPANPTGNQSEYKMAAAAARSLTDKLMDAILNPKPPTKPAAGGDTK